MSIAGAVRLGRSYIEIGADPKQLYRTLKAVEQKMQSVGKNLAVAGAKIGMLGGAAAAPFAASVRSGAKFQDVLLNIQASTGATSKDIQEVTRASMDLSKSMGIGPTAIADSFLELLKAGMPLEKVLNGAGEAAIQFAKVGQMNVAQAAVVMSDAMSVFGVDANKAANAISSAADASSTSIEGLAQAFSMTSAVAALANQKIDDVSAALAILANNGVKGSDAGTSLKTMLMRLMAPADDAVGALNQIGLTVESFRDSTGQMKPLVQILDTLNRSMGSLDQTAKDDVLRRVFGADAIRAAAILQKSGVEGFVGMRKAMDEALPVGEKFRQLMGGLSGGGSKILAALERLAIQVTEALLPSLDRVVPVIVDAVDATTKWAKESGPAVARMASLAAGAVALGAALTVLGGTISVVGTAIGGLATLGAAFATPMVAAVAAVGLAFVGLQTEIGKTAVEWVKGQDQIMAVTGPWVVSVQNTITDVGTEIAITWEKLWNGLSITVREAGSALAGVVDNILRTILQSMDDAVAAMQIGWERITSLDRKAGQARIDKIREQNRASKEETARAFPGIRARMGEVYNVEGFEDRVGAMRAERDRVKQERLASLASLGVAGAAIAGKPLGEMGPALPAGGLKSSVPGAAVDERSFAEILVDKLGGPKIAGPGASQSEVMGSFSAFAVSGMGVGGTIAERSLKVQEEIRDEIRAGNRVQE